MEEQISYPFNTKMRVSMVFTCYFDSFAFSSLKDLTFIGDSSILFLGCTERPMSQHQPITILFQQPSWRTWANYYSLTLFLPLILCGTNLFRISSCRSLTKINFTLSLFMFSSSAVFQIGDHWYFFTIHFAHIVTSSWSSKKPGSLIVYSAFNFYIDQSHPLS